MYSFSDLIGSGKLELLYTGTYTFTTDNEVKTGWWKYIPEEKLLYISGIGSFEGLTSFSYFSEREPESIGEPSIKCTLQKNPPNPR